MESKTPYREERPWGHFLRFTANEQSTVKIISVSANEALSTQYHQSRDEWWYITEGSGEALVGADRFACTPGTTLFVPRTVSHTVSAGETGLVFLEIAFGEYDENDIVRTNDRYGRQTSQTP